MTRAQALRTTITTTLQKAFSDEGPRSLWLLLVIGTVWVGLQVVTNGTFLSPRNLGLLALQTAITGLTAVGAVNLIVVRNFDLSVGSVIEFLGVIIAILMVRMGWGPLPTVVVALLLGVAIGAWQGWWVAKLGVPSFIVSLAGMLYFRGIALTISNETVAPIPTSLGILSTGWLGPVASVVLISTGLVIFASYTVYRAYHAKKLGLISRVTPTVIRSVVPVVLFALGGSYVALFRGIPYLVLVLLAVGVAGQLLQNQTRLGQQIYAVGSNPEAARLSGINPPAVIMKVWLIEGLIYGIAAIAVVVRVAGFVPGAGVYMELDAIASAIIGGTSLAGGSGTIFGGLMGALLMKSIDNGMSLINLRVWYQYITKGVILLIAVFIDLTAQQRSR